MMRETIVELLGLAAIMGLALGYILFSIGMRVAWCLVRNLVKLGFIAVGAAIMYIVLLAH